ncbi:hypothetical protein ACQ4M3_13280 [Leptolyngbya sp. AN03gr2]|uniref:hypothetical protein n=1 Tax=unclassified Leptolyngbya TaxID=2650499 RepID=UPI003D314DC3
MIEQILEAPRWNAVAPVLTTYNPNHEMIVIVLTPLIPPNHQQTRVDSFLIPLQDCTTDPNIIALKAKVMNAVPRVITFPQLQTSSENRSNQTER